VGTFAADHYRYGPLRLLMSTDAIQRMLGPSTPVKHCFRAGDCEDELRYTDGHDSLTIAYTYLHLKRGEHGSAFAHLRPGIGPLANWRWEDLPVFAVPPSRIIGWTVCDEGWENRGYCGSSGPGARALDLNFIIKRGKVTEVYFGAE